MIDRIWEDQIAIETGSEATFKTLPRAADLQDRVSWSIDPTTIKLPNPLEYYLIRDSSPIPEASDREGYFGDRHFEYWLSGLETYAFTLEFLNKYGCKRNCYVEIGSASGRVIRHVAAYDSFSEYWAFDINWRHIAWIQKFLPGNIKAVNNHSIPTLPLPDNSVDCLSAMSVFTHIESFETAWLAEIRRVLKPGGLAIISVVTEQQIEAMDETWPMYQPLKNHPRFTDAFLNDLKDVGKIVLRWHSDKSYSSNVIYSSEYLLRVWGSFFDFLEHRRQFPIFQDMLILSKNISKNSMT
jgi:ubiquinone/menaquinone biosynthesis C-methylase UbiE